MLSNYQRMMKVIDETFATRNDGRQIQVSDAERKKLQELHPSTLSGRDNGNGPIVWVLIIPTSLTVMQEFVDGKIDERTLLEKTSANDHFEALYLCSATTLPEYRRKGITRDVALGAISQMRDRFVGIRHLFYWAFSEEGKKLAQSIASATGLQLHERGA